MPLKYIKKTTLRLFAVLESKLPVICILRKLLLKIFNVDYYYYYYMSHTIYSGSNSFSPCKIYSNFFLVHPHWCRCCTKGKYAPGIWCWKVRPWPGAPSIDACTAGTELGCVIPVLPWWMSQKLWQIYFCIYLWQFLSSKQQELDLLGMPFKCSVNMLLNQAL